MLGITLLCVGRLREKHYISAFEEYAKRLGAYCRFEVRELQEIRLPENPSEGEKRAALRREGEALTRLIPKGAYTVALCVEGRSLSSEALASLLAWTSASGVSRLCFLIGGSCGLDEDVKRAAQLCLSMSAMTFPHHLARVMLAEQIYRALSINAGGRYHK